MLSLNTHTELDDDEADMVLTEVRNAGPDGGDLVGYIGKIPHARSWAAVLYLGDESTTRTVALGNGICYYTDAMVELFVSGLSMSTAETGYPAGTVLFCSPGDAKLFLLATDEERKHNL